MSFVSVVFIDFHSVVGSMICHWAGVPTRIGIAKPGLVGLPAVRDRAGGFVERSSSVGRAAWRRYWSKIGVQFLPVCSLKKRTMSSVMMFWYLNVLVDVAHQLSTTARRR